MKRRPTDGRMFVPELVARAEATDDGIVVRAPGVGLWREAPSAGARILPGDPIGTLEILGVLHRLLAPADAVGIVREASTPALARRPVDHGQALLVLDPQAAADGVDLAQVGAPGVAGRGGSAGLSFPSPLSGRYYAKPSPDAAPFCKPGDVVTRGQTVALLEVMKTFNRVTYGGDELPARAKVLAIRLDDGDDVDEGDPILDVEPA
jgi:acetyl-CoA carboxylase biotin carboxyl carrier protein